jgi:hypothetical protein
MVKSQALFRGWCKKTTNVVKKQHVAWKQHVFEYGAGPRIRT